MSAGGPPSTLHLEVFTSPTRPIGRGDMTFSPITSTLVYGDTHAVLVDAQFLTEDVDALGDVIQRTGRELRTIFITHGHGDHWFGADRLAARFGPLDIVTTPAIAAHIEAHVQAETTTWSGMFGDRITLPTTQPRALDELAIDLEGNRLSVVEVPRGDIAPCAVLHVPSLDAVVAGDVAYNQIHQMLAFGGPAEWQEWSASVDAIERLAPRTVIAGHKKPEAPDLAAAVLDGTRDYLKDFARVAGTATAATDIITEMSAKYPDHGNMTTLVVSARAAIKARDALALPSGWL